MLKIYKYNGASFQFEEGSQPDGAIEVKAEPPVKAEAPAKAAPAPANKSVKPADKNGKAGSR